MKKRYWLGTLIIFAGLGFGLRPARPHAGISPGATQREPSSRRDLESCRRLTPAEANEVRQGIILSDMIERTMIRLSALEYRLGLRDRNRGFRDRQTLVQSWFNESGFNGVAQERWLTDLEQGCEQRRTERGFRGLCGRRNTDPRFEEQVVVQRFQEIYQSQDFDRWLGACTDLYEAGIRSVEVASQSMKFCVPARWVQANVSMSDRGRRCARYMLAEGLVDLDDFDALMSFLRSDRTYSCLPGDGTEDGLCREDACVRAVSYQVKHDQLPETPFLSSANLQSQYQAEKPKIRRHLAESFAKPLLDSAIRVGLLGAASSGTHFSGGFFTTSLRENLATHCTDPGLRANLDRYLTESLRSLPANGEEGIAALTAQVDDLPAVVVSIQKLRELLRYLKGDTGADLIRVEQDPIFSAMGKLFFLVPTLRRMFEAPMHLDVTRYATTQCNNFAVMGEVGRTVEPLTTALITPLDLQVLDKLSNAEFVTAAFGLRGDLPDAVADFVRIRRDIQENRAQNRTTTRAGWCAMRERAASSVAEEILRWTAQYPVLAFQESPDGPSFFDRLVSGGSFDLSAEVTRVSQRITSDLMTGVQAACSLDSTVINSFAAQGGLTADYCNSLSAADSRALGLTCPQREGYLRCKFMNEVREWDVNSHRGEMAMGALQTTLDAAMVFTLALKGLSLSGLFNPRNWVIGGAVGAGFAWMSDQVGSSLSSGQDTQATTYLRSLAAAGLQGETGYAQVLDMLASSNHGLSREQWAETIVLGAFYGALLGPSRGGAIELSAIQTEARTQLIEILALRTGRQARLAQFLLREGRSATWAADLRLSIARALTENARLANVAPRSLATLRQFLKAGIADSFARARQTMASLRSRLLLRRARGETATAVEEAAEILNQTDSGGKTIDVRLVEAADEWSVQDQARLLEGMDDAQARIGPETVEAVQSRIGEFWLTMRNALGQCRAPLSRCGALVAQAAQRFKQSSVRLRAYLRYRLGRGDKGQFERVMPIMEQKLAQFNRDVNAWELDYLPRYNSGAGGIEIFEEGLALFCAKSPTFMMNAAEVWGSNRAYFWRMMDLSDRFRNLRRGVVRRLFRQPQQQALLHISRRYVRVLTRSELNADQLFDVMGEMAETVHSSLNSPEYTSLWFRSTWESVVTRFKGTPPWRRFAEEYATFERSRFQLQGNVRGRGIRPDVIRQFMNEGVMHTLYRRLTARANTSPEEIRLLAREVSWFFGPVIIVGGTALTVMTAEDLAREVNEWAHREPRPAGEMPEGAILISRAGIQPETSAMFDDGLTDERLATSNRVISALEEQKAMTRDSAQIHAIELQIENERALQAMELRIQAVGQETRAGP